MKKIDERVQNIADEMFSGDVEKAIEYILHSDNLIKKAYQCSWGDFEWEIANKITGEKSAEELKLDDYEYEFTHTLLISKEELRNTKVNPYKSTILKSLVAYASAIGVCFTVYGITGNIDTLINMLTCGGMILSPTVYYFIKYFKFKKYKETEEKYNDKQLNSDVDVLTPKKR